MHDIEKVIKGLECHQIDNNHRINCADCPYYVDDDNHIRCVNDLHDDALALLKEQEDLGTELTNAVELIHKKNKRIEKLMKERDAVVRCKDCISFYKNDNMFNTNAQKGMRCKASSIDPDWFCADGKRKEGW